MKTLQESLNQRLEKMSNILTPVDMTKIMTSMTKLKSALSEVTIRNAQLVMRNNELIHELSFMPPAMREKIVQAKKILLGAEDQSSLSRSREKDRVHI